MLLITVPLKNVQEIWPTKMEFGWPNAEIGRKMADLFLALLCEHFLLLLFNCCSYLVQQL